MWDSWRPRMSVAWRKSLGIPFGSQENLEGVPDGRQRISQLVRERREELVLAAVGLPQGRRPSVCAR